MQPLLKWAGGKEKELKHIIPNIPQGFHNYYEPFVGGGSVFTAISANHYYINDFSSELISLYQNIAGQNRTFFNYVDGINNAWENAYNFFAHNQTLINTYLAYQQDAITKDELKQFILRFCDRKRTEILNVVAPTFNQHHDFLISEMKTNLFRKMSRMKVLEHEKHFLPEEDLYDNIETAIKSALYMYFRALYNDRDIATDNDELHCALFLFIRNYSYSGMFRYNSDGGFNVPYGGIGYNTKTMAKKLQYYQSPTLLNRLAHTTIENLDFEQFLRVHSPTENDFVFLDPPYDSEFSTYARNEFTREDQRRLADYMINECRARWMMIIKNTEFIYELYAHDGINICTFDKEYLVSFMNRNDKKVTHLLITNY
ncbi:MAG: DNA adenine methylase [Bacteroides sp.]|nr:DNA adenine methylase [Bacteroides sp.]